MNNLQNLSAKQRRMGYAALKLVGLYLPLLLMLAFVLVPFLWALSTSLKEPAKVLSEDLKLLPDPATISNFPRVWTEGRFATYFANSIFVSLVSVVAIIFLAIVNAYALSRFKFKGSRFFMILLLGTQMIPIVLLVTPLFMAFKDMGIINTPWSLIVFYIVTQLPFSTLLMKGFVDSIPKSVDEAAMVDGAGRLRIIFTIIAPVLQPGIVAVCAFAFIGCWNEFLGAFSFITSAVNFTIPVGLKFMIGEYSVDYAGLAAGSIIALLPPLVLFAYIQKFLIQGLSSGSVKE